MHCTYCAFCICSRYIEAGLKFGLLILTSMNFSLTEFNYFSLTKSVEVEKFSFLLTKLAQQIVIVYVSSHLTGMVLCSS